MDELLEHKVFVTAYFVRDLGGFIRIELNEKSGLSSRIDLAFLYSLEKKRWF